jgi:N-acetylneuraminic acid mutarotase
MKRLFQSVLALSLVVILSNGLSAQQMASPMDDARCNGVAPAPALEKGGPDQVMGQWTVGTKIPVPKKYHTVASYNGDIYVFGGVTTNNVYNAKCFKYSTTTNSWSAIADFPRTRFLFGAAQTINGKIYIAAALSNLNAAYDPIRRLFIYDPVANKYDSSAALMPVAQAFCASGVIDNKIYYIAGSSATNTAYIKTVQRYDPATDTWDSTTAYPRDVRYTAGATVNGKIIVSGGFNAAYTPTRYIADTYVGDLSGGTLRWTKVKDYPYGAIIQVTAGSAGSFAYFMAGWPAADGNKPATQRSYKYDPATDTWTTLEAKPTGMMNCSQAGTDGTRIYVAGGEGGDAAYTPTDAMEILDANVTGAPVLVLSKTTVDEWVKKGASPTFPFVLKNNGTADLTWNVSIDAGASAWLSASKTSGSIPSFTGTSFNLVVNSANLNPGVQSTDVTLTSNDPNNATKPIRVTIHVQNEDVDEALNALMEEGTGTWCGYCPYGADSLKAVIARYPGRVYGISYHGGPGQNSTDGMWIKTVDTWSSLTQLQGWPNGAVNRIKFEGNSFICMSRGEWNMRVSQVIDSLRSPVGINILSASYSRNTHQIEVEVEVFFHRDLTGQVRLNIAQVQDSLNYRQTFYPASGGTTYLFPYYHNHVLRQMIPNDFGEVLTGQSVTSQTRVRKSFSFASKDSLRELSRLIVFAHYSDGTSYGQVLQTEEIDLGTMVTGAEQPAAFDLSLSQNYPNPFTGSSVIEYSVQATSDVQIVVTDMLGREVSRLVNGSVAPGRHAAQFVAGSLPAGLYQLTMRAGNFTQTRTMSLIK